MQVYISDNYQQQAELAAAHLAECMSFRPQPLICVASGDSPAGMYASLISQVNNNSLNIDQWNFVGLDEWLGMNGNDEGSCRYHLNRQLFDPLKIDAAKICFFDGRAADPDNECSVTENFILDKGGIDLTILGLGFNGHVGMNEPGSSPDSRCRVVALDPLTVQTGQKYFSEAKELDGGLTLGIGTIMESKNIFLLVNGLKKAAVVKTMLEGLVSPQLPASLILQHPSIRIYLDKEAASLLTHKHRTN